MNTESFLEGVLLDGIDASETPPFSKRLSEAPVLTEGYLTLSPKTINQEIVKYSGVSGNSVTIVARGFDTTGTSTNVANQKKHSKNTSSFKGALNHIIIDEKVNKTDLASTENGEGASTIGVEDAGGYYSSSTVEGVLAELGVGAPGVADASETVAGKVELPTDVEFTAGTATGSTGATLTPTNVQLNKSISLKGSITSTTDSDEFVVNQGGVDKRITQANLRTQLAGDETKLGTVQKATDTEVIAGVEDTKYITPKQAFVGYKYKSGTTHILARDTGTIAIPNSQTTLIKVAEIKVEGPFAAGSIVRASIEERNGSGASNKSGDFYFYKNGVEQSGPISIAGLTFSATSDTFSIQSGDLIQIYAQSDNSGYTSELRDFIVSADLIGVDVVSGAVTQPL